MISRRRLLIVAAAAGCTGFTPRPGRVRWQGRAFGAETSISLYAETNLAQAAIAAAKDTIMRLEGMFSLYDPRSALSVLNRTGRLTMPPEFARLVVSAGEAHDLTGGLFDPTVQPLFALNAAVDNGPTRGDLERVQRLIGWQKVSIDGHTVHLREAGMSLTLNGIAQGFATDRVCEVLTAHGFERFLINIGEYRGSGELARLTAEDISGNGFAEFELRDAAVATSASHGSVFANGAGHILRPDPLVGEPVSWKTVTVQAPTATTADAFSTALILAPDASLARWLKANGHIQCALLQDVQGRVIDV